MDKFQPHETERDTQRERDRSLPFHFPNQVPINQSSPNQSINQYEHYRHVHPLPLFSKPQNGTEGECCQTKKVDPAEQTSHISPLRCTTETELPTYLPTVYLPKSRRAWWECYVSRGTYKNPRHLYSSLDNVT